MDAIAKRCFILLNGYEHQDPQYMREEGLYMPVLVLLAVVEVWVALLLIG